MTTDKVARIQAQWARERPDLDFSPMGVIGRLHLVAAHLTDELVAVYAQFGLTEAEFDVLAALRRSPDGCAPSELADTTMVTTGGMTKRLDRLQAEGLVERNRAAGDGRARIVRLTAAGRDLIDRAVTAHAANEHRLLEQIGGEAVGVLEPVLRDWLGRFEPEV
ncbi:MAG: MarR family transcriptional regulator [Actinobacteria bacterium]|nr:MarR family transcriptional regulator [Actinomycetota bacterium]MCG2801758.1 MarR family transcriptional regulator [Cellulomonas sp.]